MASFLITVTVVDSVTNAPLRGVLLTAKDNADAVIVAQAYTSNAGVAVLTLAPATYKLHLGPMAGYNPISIQTLVVSSVASVTYTLGFLTIGTPASANLCRVFGFEYQDGVAVPRRLVWAQLVGAPHQSSGTVLESGQPMTVTDATGFWYLDLVMGQVYRIIIAESGIGVSVTIPFAPVLNLSQAI